MAFNKSVLLAALNTSEVFLNSSTTLGEIYEEDDWEEESSDDEWPYFSIFGKTYSSFIVGIALLGVIGNGLAFILMTDVTIRSFAYTIYIRWLAVWDSSLLLIVAMEDIIDTYGNLQHFLGYHLAICKIWHFVNLVSTILSPWLVVALTVDRFVCVVLPLSRHRFCTKSKAVITCIALTLMSAMFSIGSLTNSIIYDEECVVIGNMHYINYMLFQMIIGMAILPCFIVLILNVVIVARIRQGTLFRERFRKTGSKGNDENPQKKDKSTLPLVLLSVFAFITQTPRAISASVEFVLSVTESDYRAKRLADELWPLFNLIYLLNFAQNFYIMMASSGMYRDIMARKLSCISRRRLSSKENNPSNTSSTRIPTCSVYSTEVAELGT